MVIILEGYKQAFFFFFFPIFSLEISRWPYLECSSQTIFSCFWSLICKSLVSFSDSLLWPFRSYLFPSLSLGLSLFVCLPVSVCLSLSLCSSLSYSLGFSLFLYLILWLSLPLSLWPTPSFSASSSFLPPSLIRSFSPILFSSLSCPRIPGKRVSSCYPGLKRLRRNCVAWVNDCGSGPWMLRGISFLACYSIPLNIWSHDSYAWCHSSLEEQSW